jgi:hypothetical protein
MRYRLIAIIVCLLLHLAGMNSVLMAESCVSTWTSPDPNQTYAASRTWLQSMPSGCYAACAKVSITLQVHNYNDAGTLDLYCSNTNEIDYGDPYSVFTAPKLGWVGRVNVPQSFVSPGWKTVSFVLRKPHLEWLNDDGTLYFALEGPAYISVNAQFQIASATIETIEANTDIDGDGDTDGDDLWGLIDNLGCSGTCTADFDGDGVVDENDIFDFSDEYGWTGCPLGYYESFDDGFANGWFVDSFGVWTVNNGVFSMTGLQPSPARLRWSYYNQVFDDFAFDVSVKQTQGIQTNAAGIIFRSSVTISSRYEFLISVAGAYMINKHLGGASTPLVPWTASNRILKGYNLWNRLRVVCLGQTMQFYINGGLVDTVNDSSLSSGRAGVMAVDIDTDINTFQFEDVLLEEK